LWAGKMAEKKVVLSAAYWAEKLAAYWAGLSAAAKAARRGTRMAASMVGLTVFLTVDCSVAKWG